jgi:hypothetical protein
MSCVLLAGCGTTPSDRALSGGLLGAGAGAAIGSVAGGAGTGAVIGAVSGAAIGALTKPDQVNLGRPVWRNGEHEAHNYHHRHYASSKYTCHQTSDSTRVCKRVASR